MINNKNITLNNNILISQDTTGVYQWIDCSNSYIPLQGQTERYYTPSTSGSYAVIITKNGCVDTSLCLNFISCKDLINKNIVLINNVIYSEDSLCNYQWLNCSKNYSTIIGQTSKSFTPLSSGSYAVRLSNSFCIDTSKCFFVIVDTNKQSVQSSFYIYPTLYPNPARDKLYIKQSGINKIDYEIYDLVGKKLLIGQTRENIDVYMLSEGLYLLHISTKEGNMIKKFEIKR